MADVQLYNPATNLVQSFDEETARQRIRSGFGEVATPQQVQRDIIERKYAGGIGNEALALGAGLARGGTFGLSDVALSELGGNDYREALQAYRELHPVASTVGELAGAALVPIPGGGLAAAGERTLASVGKAALREAAIGGAYGLAGGLTEAALSGQGYSGEALAASMGLGALIGGGIGGAFAGGRLVRRGGQSLQSAVVRPGEEAIETIMAKATGEKAADGLGGAVGRLWARTSELAGVKGTTEGAELLALNRAGMEARRVATNATKEIEQATEVFNAAGRKTEEAARLLHEKVGVAKYEQWAAKVKVAAPADTLEAARMQAWKLQERAVEMTKAGKGAFAKQDAIKLFKDKIDDTLYKLYYEVDDPARAAWMLDETKRDLGSLARKHGQKAKMSNQRATVDAFKSMYEDTRTFLENGAVWGDEAAEMQRSINKSYTDLFDQARNDPRLGRFLESREGGFGEPGHKVFSDVGSTNVLKNVLDPSNAEAAQAWAGRQTQIKDLIDTALEHMTLTDAERATLSAARPAAEEQIKLLEHVKNVATREKQLQGMDPGGMSVLGMMLGSAAGAAFASDGDAGAAAPLAIAAGLIANPRRAARQLAGLESLIGASVRATTKAGQQIVTKRASGGLLPRVATWSAIQVAERAKFLRGIDTVKNTSSEQVAQQTQRNLGMFGAVAPKVVQNATETAVRAHEYLQEHAPKPVGRPGTIMALSLPPSDYEIDLFERRRKVVNDPMTVLREIDQGTLTPEAVHAISNVYPEMYKQLKQSITVELGELAGRGESLPYKQIVPLELFLGQPIEGISSPDVVKTIQESYTREIQGPDGVKRKDTFKTKMKAGRPAPDVGKFYNQENDPVLREVG